MSVIPGNFGENENNIFLEKRKSKKAKIYEICYKEKKQKDTLRISPKVNLNSTLRPMEAYMTGYTSGLLGKINYPASNFTSNYEPLSWLEGWIDGRNSVNQEIHHFFYGID